MASSVNEAQLECSIEAFNAEFVRNGFGNAPAGLLHIFRTFEAHAGESARDARSRMYKRLWCLLWFGSAETLGSGLPKRPTYVYPKSLKEIIRHVVQGDLGDYDDPTHDSVYHVNIADLAAAKWPAIKKTK